MRLSFRLALMISTLASWPGDPARSAGREGLAVEVTNQSEPVLCAEKDNVTLSFASKEVETFRIEASHPVYMAHGLRDNWDADWTACDMSSDPDHAASTQPRKLTLYDDLTLRIVGITLPSFWRPATAKVRIGDSVEPNLHLLQVWLSRTEGHEEVLAFYPQDGYWRPRPFTPSGVSAVPFGSSFLVGPVETRLRPFVDIDEIAFDPASRTFRLAFARGGSAKVRMTTTDTSHIVLDVAFDRPVTEAPFAALRSMYITEFNNDVARIALRESGATSWREANIMSFDRAFATDVWAGRLSPSQHNGTSPDIVFGRFSDGRSPTQASSARPADLEPGSPTAVR
jgi:hypothetical protein